MDEDDMIGGLSFKGSSDYSCATSVTDEDGYGTKAPGVVARLMGLDSLPTTNFSDTYSNASFDSQSLRESTNYIRKDPAFDPIDCQMEPVHTPLIVKRKDFRAIEKFRTETLPPKSAKSIPITHHKLLSPIKNSKYVSCNNPDRIMEAASKIPLVGSSSPSPSLTSSSSVPFKARVLREKMEHTRKPKIPEAARKPSESNTVKNLKSQQSLEPKKSISLALQAKANVQKREGMTHRAQSVKTQSNPEKNQPKNPIPSKVLRQNNQKQNNLVDRGKSTPKSSSSVIGPQSRKPVSQKTSHKKEPYSVTRRKRSMEDTDRNNNNHPEKNFVQGRSSRSNKNDIVSFTFTSPLVNRSKNIVNASNPSLLSYNVIGGDALSTLLEQKLRELTDTSVSQDSMAATESDMRDDSAATENDMRDDDSSYAISSYDPLHLAQKHSMPDQDCDDSSYALSSNDPSELMKKQHKLDIVDMDQDSSYEFSTNNPMELVKKNHILDLGEDLTYAFSSNDRQQRISREYEYRKILNGQEPSPTSVLEPSFISESCNSSDPANMFKQNSASVQAQQLIATSFSTNLTLMEVDTELLDSASSVTSVATKWEPDYVKSVLADIETMFDDFTIGKTRKLVNPRVFDRLEFGKPNDEVSKLRRELMFNCVSECMESKCRVWGKGLTIVKKPNSLANEVYNEITGWEDMKDSMVDELVDKDMSGRNYNKWLDYDVEAFEIGVEIEARLLDSLINEVVDDILVV
ncbi:uncharacterized protein [Rutidosis leptorrhynchoides]|uniref:uncharacterized protein n=1 Tax=Rutidosis leptorrhynchoides TaxID=125765 RepID=UPI003A9A2953